MPKNKTKDHFNALPVERHETAAWQNTTVHKPISGVIITDEEAARNAKDYVDANQK